MKIGILKTDAVREEWVSEHGEYPDMFAALLGAADPALTFTTYDVRLGEYPAAIEDEDAYLITGSRHSVYDPLPWIAPLMDFVRELDQRRIKLVGICFGHQLIAEALGGSTRKAEQGWGVGLHRHRFSDRPDWFDDGDLEAGIAAQHGRRQSAGAGTDNYDPLQGLRHVVSQFAIDARRLRRRIPPARGSFENASAVPSGRSYLSVLRPSGRNGSLSVCRIALIRDC